MKKNTLVGQSACEFCRAAYELHKMLEWLISWSFAWMCHSIRNWMRPYNIMFYVRLCLELTHRSQQSKTTKEMKNVHWNQIHRSSNRHEHTTHTEMIWCGMSGETIWIWNKKPHPWHNCISLLRCMGIGNWHQRLQMLRADIDSTKEISNECLICVFYIYRETRVRTQFGLELWRAAHRLHGIRNVEKAKQTIVS